MYRECKSDTVFIRVYVSVENTPGELLLQFRLFNKRNDVCSMRPFRVINDGLNNHTYGRLVCVGGKARELPAGAIVLEF